MHVDNWNPDTYTWILKECDVPYIPEKWSSLLAKWGRDASKITGTTILGRYLSSMRIKPYSDYRWKDTQFLQEMADAKQEEAMKRSGYNAAQIAQALEMGRIDMPPRPDPVISEPQPPVGYNDEPDEEMQQMIASLTDEDRKYLRLKWGKSYRPDEWIQLEKLWTDMENSYDIQTAGHKDTLKMLCKTSLKANQLLDANDIEGFQRLSKVYDSLSKQGNFTAAQNKADKGEYVNSVSELVAICEKDGFIPKYYVDEPKDKVDATIQDIKNYTHDLVANEMNLGSLIEDAVRKFNEEELRNDRADNGEDVDSDNEEYEIFHHDEVEELENEDYEEYNNFIQKQKEQDDV